MCEPMKYISQFSIIFGFSVLGEALHRLIPLPIAASVYGLVLLFLALCLKLVKVEQVQDVGHFLISILSLLFVSPTVGIVDCWSMIQPQLLNIFLLLVASTAVTFGISGVIAQALMKRKAVKQDG